MTATNTNKEFTMTSLKTMLSALVLISSSTAFAESVTHEVAPIRNALEIAVGGAYMQNAGDIGDGMNAHGLSRAGGGAEVQIGYRLTPNLTVGGYGTLSSFTTGRDVAPTTDLVIGSNIGAKADWHFRPSTSVDPWISVGVGWRGLWLGNDAGTETKLQGMDLARVQLGVDYRFTDSFALTPYLGVAASTFFQKADMTTDGYEGISGKGVNWSFTGGLLARFDVLGTRGN